MNFLNPFLKTKILFRIMVPVISFTMICGNTIAQNAKNTSITVPQWTTEQDYTEPHLSGKWHGEMKKIITVLASWIQEAWPDSQQCNPAWSGAYFSSKANALPVLKYELRAGFSGGHFNITVNDHSLLEQSLVCYRTSWSLLRPMKELYKGILYNEITGEKEDTAASPQTTRTWLITRAGKLPYTFITRREYLEEAKKEILMDKERVREHLKQLIPLRSAEEQEAAKKRDLQEIGNMYNGMMRANRERIYLEAYRPDSVYFNETLSARAAPLDSVSSVMDSLLSRSPKDSLDKPACISRPALAFRGFEDGMPGGRMLVKWNTTYFSTNVSPVKPQFLVVTWQYDPADNMAASIDRQLMDKLDIRDLTQFLSSLPDSSTLP